MQKANQVVSAGTKPQMQADGFKPKVQPIGMQDINED
jgi:hypothetical protein